jgi:hypothetical protein
MLGQHKMVGRSIQRYGSIILTPLVLSLFSGCVTRHAPFMQRLDRAVGTMTYEDASRIWGIPKAIEERDDTIIARWILGRRVFVNIPMAAIPGGLASAPYPLSQQWELELRFDRAMEQLNGWGLSHPLALFCIGRKGGETMTTLQRCN